MLNGYPVNGGAVNSAPTAAIRETVFESAVVTGNETTPLTIWHDEYETAVVTGNETTPLTIWHDELETAVITSTYDIIRTAKLDLTETAKALSDYVATRVVHLDVSETAVIIDGYELSNPRNDVYETAVIVSAPTLSATRQLDVLETAKALDTAYPSGGQTESETAVITDNAYPRTIQRLVVDETAVITGADDLASQGLLLDILETAVIMGTPFDRLDAKEVVHEEAFLNDTTTGAGGDMEAGGFPANTVWTASVYSWAMSRHTSTPLTNRTRRYAVSPDGLFEVGSTYSDATLETGRMDLKTARLKRTSTLYMQGVRDGTMTTTVTADVDGAETEYSYTPVARTHDDPRSIRTDIGMGFRSTYFKLKIDTTGRAELFGGKLQTGASRERSI